MHEFMTGQMRRRDVERAAWVPGAGHQNIVSRCHKVRNFFFRLFSWFVPPDLLTIKIICESLPYLRHLVSRLDAKSALRKASYIHRTAQKRIDIHALWSCEHRVTVITVVRDLQADTFCRLRYLLNLSSCSGPPPPSFLCCCVRRGLAVER